MQISDFTEVYGRILRLVITLLTIVAVGACSSRSRYDDTDPPNGISGVDVFTDNLTGCQYLGWRLHTVTPRMDSRGKQVCKKGGE